MFLGIKARPPAGTPLGVRAARLRRPESWLPYAFTSIDAPSLDEIVQQIAQPQSERAVSTSELLVPISMRYIFILTNLRPGVTWSHSAEPHHSSLLSEVRLSRPSVPILANDIIYKTDRTRRELPMRAKRCGRIGRRIFLSLVRMSSVFGI